MDTKTTPPEGEPHDPKAGSGSGRRKATGGPAEFWTGAGGPQAFEALAENHRQALERVAEMQQTMIARLQELQELELDYVGRLAACGTPSEAIEVMAKWTAARMEAILDGQRAMQRMVIEAMSKAGEAGAKAAGPKAGR